jgi:hypothetical protein
MEIEGQPRETLVFLWMNEETRGHKTKTSDCIVSKNGSNPTAADALRPWGSHYDAIQKGETEHLYFNERTASQIYAEPSIESVDIDLICIMQFESYLVFFTNSIELFC